MGRKPGSKNKSKTPTEQPAATTGEVLGEPGNVTPMTEGQSPEPGGEEAEGRIRQTEIPGTERPKIPEIEEAAELYVQARDRRQAATKAEVKAKQDLAALMHAHRDEIGENEKHELIYHYDDMEVRLSPKDEALKVKHVKEESPGVITVGAPGDKSEGE